MHTRTLFAGLVLSLANMFFDSVLLASAMATCEERKKKREYGSTELYGVLVF